MTSIPTRIQDKKKSLKEKEITDLANLKAEVDELVIDKLVPVQVNLSKLSYVVKNDVDKKIV